MLTCHFASQKLWTYGEEWCFVISADCDHMVIDKQHGMTHAKGGNWLYSLLTCFRFRRCCLTNCTSPSMRDCWEEQNFALCWARSCTCAHTANNWSVVFTRRCQRSCTMKSWPFYSVVVVVVRSMRLRLKGKTGKTAGQQKQDSRAVWYRSTGQQRSTVVNLMSGQLQGTNAVFLSRKTYTSMARSTEVLAHACP